MSHEFHGWIVLQSSPADTEPEENLDWVAEFRQEVADIRWSSGRAELTLHNGSWLLTLHCFPNRKRDESDEMRRLATRIAEKLPGSYGIIYESDWSVELDGGRGGRGAFVVTVIRRGTTHTFLDPFLSPLQPNIEDI